MTPRTTQIGVTQPCTHPRARHEHGHHVTYKRDRCGCSPCTTAYRRWRKARSGRLALVDAGRARAHVEALLAAGLSVGQVQDRSGVNRSTIRTLIGAFPGRGRLVKVQRPTERRLLAVGFHQVDGDDRGLVDPTGSARRLQALVANGWTQKQLTAALGWCKPEDLRPVLHAEHPVRIRTRRDVAALYDRLWDQPPPATTVYEKRMATRARRYAQERGWVAPLWWDDDTLDDPTARPANEDQPKRKKGDPNALRVVHPDDVEFLADAGLTRDSIAFRIGVDPGTLQVSLERAGRRDLWLRLCRRQQDHATSPRRAAA